MSISYVIICYEWHLDWPRVLFTRPLRQRTLLNWSGGVYYNLKDSGSIDLLELIRTKFHEMEQSLNGVISDSGFLHGPLCPIDQEYVVLDGRTNDLYSFATPHQTFPTLPCLESISTNKEQCVYCRSYMHSTYECDPYRQFAKQSSKLNRYQVLMMMRWSGDHVVDHLSHPKGLQNTIHGMITWNSRTTFFAQVTQRGFLASGN